MWYTMAEHQHWPTERMIAEGHSDYATVEDLGGLGVEILEDIAKLCEVDSFAPDECIPCRAHVEVIEYRRNQAEAALTRAIASESEPVYEEPEPGSPADLNTPSFERVSEIDFEPDPQVQEELNLVDERAQTLASALTSGGRSLVPVAERFANQVDVLQHMVAEMLQGPPIPPREISLPELGSLAFGAKHWLTMIDSMGVTLSAEQEALREEVRRVVAKVFS